MGRRERLLLEYEQLINLEKRSDFIKILPIEMIPGMPPEKYVVTFNCQGVASLNADKTPIITTHHQVQMNLSREFPNKEPHLRWLTPIWHPNIDHNEPNHVCTNNVQNWFPSKSLHDLVVTLGEMVQYKHYHALWQQPWPLDKEAADWVVEYAEPKGIITRDKPLDARDLLRTYKLRGGGEKAKPTPSPKPSGKLSIGRRVTQEQQIKPPQTQEPPQIQEPLRTQESLAKVAEFVEKIKGNGNPTANVSLPPTPELTPRRGIAFGNRTKEVVCAICQHTQNIPLSTLNTQDHFCGSCQALLFF